jgi:hypothetical protein
VLRRLPILLSLLLTPALPVFADALPQSFPYSVYTDMAAAHADDMAGRDLLQRFIASDPQGLLIRFPPGSDARATIHLRSGVLRYAADDKDEMRLPDKREWRRDNPRIELSVRPLALALDFGG